MMKITSYSTVRWTIVTPPLPRNTHHSFVFGAQYIKESLLGQVNRPNTLHLPLALLLIFQMFQLALVVTYKRSFVSDNDSPRAHVCTSVESSGDVCPHCRQCLTGNDFLADGSLYWNFEQLTRNHLIYDDF